MEYWCVSKHKSWLLMLMIIDSLMVWQTQSVCIKEERKALLEIKASLIDSYDVDPPLRTWVDDGSTSDECCDWERVKCNTTTRHVTDLSLSNIMDGCERIWPLNVSLFLHFKELTKLDLSNDCLDNNIVSTGLGRLSSLKKLESLDLSMNGIHNGIFPSLGALTSLRVLHLGYNHLEGYFPALELAGLTRLEELDLTWNWLNHTQSIQEMSHLRDLKVLLLRGNLFNGTLPMEALASFHHLEVLDLSYNQFVGSIPSTIRALSSSLSVVLFAGNNLNGSLLGLCKLNNLHELDLSSNMFNGNMPHCFNNLSSLKVLDISSNRFTGIPMPSLIANLTSLEYIDFSNNKLEGLFSFSLFSNHTKLEVVRFISNNDKFEVETEEPIGWIPMFQLKLLVLSSCNMNRVKGSVVPRFLLNQRKLQVMDLSHNSLVGQFPNWLIENNTMLKVLNLRNNLFNGIICMPLYMNANIRWMDMSENHMNGTIPGDIHKFLPNIVYLNMSSNSLDGGIPSAIGDMSKLQALDLSDNELSREVPKELLTNQSSLKVLKLSKNRFHGQLLTGNISFGSIHMLHLDSNFFTGRIGNGNNHKYSYLGSLDISNNIFTGTIPHWISNTRYLSELTVSNNGLEGRFPCGTTSFSFLDISQNSFSGPIPSCLNFQDTKHLYLGSNKFTGSIPKVFRNLTNVLTLDLSNNFLSGRIPKFLGELSYLRILILRKNNFSGSIPMQLCQLSNTSLIDLSGNSLSGSIPRCLQNVTKPIYPVFVRRGVLEISFYNYKSFLYERFYNNSMWEVFEIQDEVQFTTKFLSLAYKGSVLDYMVGLDLSCNKLIGEIPKELGLLIEIRSLNLSHNKLSGPIPLQFSNLAKIESLDLSSNGLSGKVPSQLIQLTFLAAFNISYNNLSGRLPEMRAQFSTFTKASYEGNPLLCGPPLEKKCTTTLQVNDSSVGNDSSTKEGIDKWYDIDMVFFYGSFSATWAMFLLGFVTLLYTNPYLRRRWLDLVEDYMYHFLGDSINNPKECVMYVFVFF